MTEKYCPFKLSSMGVSVNCEEEKCAWWHMSDAEECAIHKITRMLTIIANSMPSKWGGGPK